MVRTTTAILRTGGAALLAATLLAACGSARYVNRTQYNGVIALEGDRNKAMEQAHQQMAAHCGPGQYTILREGETVVGQDQVARSDSYVEEDGESQVASSSTRDATEWRVEYQCAGAPPAPAPSAPAEEPYPEQGQPPPPPPGY
jgi:hypothetical protein